MAYDEPQHSASIRAFPGAGRPFRSDGADSLSLCLEFLTRYFGNPRPAAAIAGDLPHVDGRLTLGGFVQAAERVALATQIQAIRIGAIPHLALPAVLLLRDGGACLLIKADGATATIVGPSFSDGVRMIALAELEAAYAGRAIYVRPRFQFDRATDLLDLPPARSWLWSTLRQDWSIYLQAVLATVMINLFTLALPFFTSLVFDRVVPHRALDTLHVLTLGAAAVIVFD
ncbi:MAG: type I secretion system permease/ATPase, partial [Alphaproteobacteria bacterium]|nr:type I secretion system permease/ATPase [Alphaproteobacteria bacterium]